MTIAVMSERSGKGITVITKRLKAYLRFLGFPTKLKRGFNYPDDYYRFIKEKDNFIPLTDNKKAYLFVGYKTYVDSIKEELAKIKEK